MISHLALALGLFAVAGEAGTVQVKYQTPPSLSAPAKQGLPASPVAKGATKTPVAPRVDEERSVNTSSKSTRRSANTPRVRPVDFGEGALQPAPVPLEPTVVPDERMAEPVPGGEMGEAGIEGDDCGCGCGAGHRCTWHSWWFSRCDFGLHFPYYPAEHGYYYFRPYHHQHIAEHQAFVASFGGDPRNPYDNKIFQRVYAELRDQEASQSGRDGDAKPIPQDEPPVPPAAEGNGQ